MSNVYLAMEGMGLVVILILLYANVFEIKQHTIKRSLFTLLLLLDEIILLADTISWMKLGWEDKQAFLWVLVVIAFIVPYFAQAVFSRYLYEHISEKVKINKLPFSIVIGYSMLLGAISFGLCAAGKMFSIVDGKYYEGSVITIYYLFYLVSLVLFLAIIIMHSKKMGAHDTVAAFVYCAIPIVALLLSMMDIGISISVGFLPIEVLVIYIMLQSEGENKLYYQSNNDELTGLYNRRAYEDDLMQYPDVPPEENFVYASIDVNGLKMVNDNQGHAAGDELIQGVAACLKQTLGNYGRVYRIGGDEFAAMFFADEEKLEFLKKDLEMVCDEWHGKLVDSLTLSVGFVTKKEFPTQTVDEIAKIADGRMYQAKSAYYKQKGIDRRGQAAAHTALCKLYTKILKINLTDDSYTILTMDFEEKTKEKGFANTISGWLHDFGESGQVHEEDLDTYFRRTDLNYLKEYFGKGKKSISIYYRRKYNDVFKLVTMEMIPAEDYEADNQSLYLYVKTVDM